MKMKMSRLLYLLIVVQFWSVFCFSDPPTIVTRCKQDAQTELDLFKKTDDYQHLIKAYACTAILDSDRQQMRNTNVFDLVISTKLTIFDAFYKAKTPDLGVTRQTTYHNVLPPPKSGLGIVGGQVDPNLITNPVVREQYRAAIKENEHREAQLIRELDLERF